jgi:hypothetical protein
MNKNALADKLLASRRLPPVAPNGDSPIASIVPTGSKLSEAASYLKSARICLLTWVRANYVNSDNVDQNTDHVRELLAIANSLEGTRATLDVKASILEK